MMVVAAWCAAAALLLWLDRLQWVWAAALGVSPAIALASQRAPFMGTLILTAALYFLGKSSRDPVPPRALQEAIMRFWRQTGVLLTAGLTFWQAVEVSADSEPLLTGPIAQAAQRMTRRGENLAELGRQLGRDGPISLLLLQHGYQHGISVDQIMSQVRHIEARLEFEDEAKKRRDPLWMTVLPAVLLLNVLWLFLAPMVALAGHSWMKL